MSTETNTIDLRSMTTGELIDLDHAIMAERRARAQQSDAAMHETIAATMSARRQASGLTISEVAERAKVSPAAVRRAETAGTSSMTTLYKILDRAYGETDPMGVMVAMLVEAGHARDSIRGVVAA